MQVAVCGDTAVAREMQCHTSVTAAFHIVKAHPLAHLHVQSM